MDRRAQTRRAIIGARSQPLFRGCSGRSDTFLSLNAVTFDPTQSHQVYGANGDGIFKPTAPTVGTTFTWNGDETAGIENLDLQPSSIPLPGGGIGFAAQDRPAWYMPSLSSYATKYQPNNLSTIRFGDSVCGNAR